MESVSSKCQNCGSDLRYDIATGMLVCSHCDTNYILPKKSEKAIITRQYSTGFHPNQLCQSLEAYKCNSCGNVYYISSDEMSKKCTNCGKTSVTLIEDSGYSADGIIPFKISKEEASKQFAKFLKTQKGIPKSMKKMAQEQKLMGVYVPVWNFHFNIFADYSATKTELKKDSNGYFYSVPKPIFGNKVERIKSLDECATTNQDEILLDLFDENDYANIIPFVPEYTYGYRVDGTDKDIHDYYYNITNDSEDELKKRIKKEINSSYKYVSDINILTEAKDIFFNYTYVPVYINSFTYRGKTYKTYVSGTTGKTVGKTPVSLASKVKKFVKVLVLLGAACAIVYYLSKK